MFFVVANWPSHASRANENPKTKNKQTNKTIDSNVIE